MDRARLCPKVVKRTDNKRRRSGLAAGTRYNEKHNETNELMAEVWKQQQRHWVRGIA